MGENMTKRLQPAMIAPDPLHRESDLTRLDGLIDRITSVGDEKEEDGRDLLLEHLRSARQHLLGAMPIEYVMDLEDAIFASRRAPIPGMRDEVENAIEELLREVPAFNGASIVGNKTNPVRARR